MLRGQTENRKNVTLTFVLLFSISPRVACRANFRAVSRVLPMVLKSQYSRFHHGWHVARISVCSRDLPVVLCPKNQRYCGFNILSVIHFSGESASLLVEKRQSGSEPHNPDHDVNEHGVKEVESRRLKSNHVSLLERNERQFYDNLLVSRNHFFLFIDKPRAFLASVLPISAHYFVARRNKQNAQHQSTVPNPRAFHRKARF